MTMIETPQALQTEHKARHDATAEAMATQGVIMEYDRIRKVLGEGDFVLL